MTESGESHVVIVPLGMNWERVYEILNSIKDEAHDASQ